MYKVHICTYLWWKLLSWCLSLISTTSANAFEYVWKTPDFVFCQFLSKLVAWCTCPCILSFLPLASLPRTQSPHSSCTLGSGWEIWNGYSNCSAWLDWDIDETADCSYPGSINSYCRGFLRICIRLQDPPLCSYVYCFVYIYLWDLHVLYTNGARV